MSLWKFVFLRKSVLFLYQCTNKVRFRLGDGNVNKMKSRYDKIHYTYFIEYWKYGNSSFNYLCNSLSINIISWCYSCSERSQLFKEFGAYRSFCFRFNYLKHWKTQSPLKIVILWRSLWRNESFYWKSENGWSLFDLDTWTSRFNEYFLIFRSWDHRDAKWQLFMWTSRKEERKKTRAALHKCCASHRIKKEIN